MTDNARKTDVVHFEFDRAEHPVDADARVTEGFLIVDGDWHDPRTQRSGPYPLSFTPDQLRGENRVLGADLRAEVARAAGDEGLSPADVQVVVRISGCGHRFNPAGEVLSLIAGKEDEL